MTTNELLNILYTVPYGKLINGTVDYRVRTFTDVTSNFARVDIDFLRGNTCIFQKNTKEIQRISVIVNALKLWKKL